MRYWLMTVILTAVCCANVVRGQACFLDNGYSAIGGVFGGTTSEGRSGAYGGVLISQNAWADFSLGLQSISVEGGSTKNFVEQCEFFLVRQRERGAQFFWSIGQSFSLHLPFGNEQGPGQNIFGCFSTLSRSIRIDEHSALRPGVGMIWEKATAAESSDASGGVVSLDFAGGSGNRGTLFVVTLAVADSFERGGQTSLSVALSLTGVKEYRGR